MSVAYVRLLGSHSLVTIVLWNKTKFTCMQTEQVCLVGTIVLLNNKIFSFTSIELQHENIVYKWHLGLRGGIVTKWHVKNVQNWVTFMDDPLTSNNHKLDFGLLCFFFPQCMLNEGGTCDTSVVTDQKRIFFLISFFSLHIHLIGFEDSKKTQHFSSNQSICWKGKKPLSFMSIKISCT